MLKNVAGRVESSDVSDEDNVSEIVSSPTVGQLPPLDAAHIPKKLWRHSTIEICDAIDPQNEAKVLVLYTGGTIGMMRNDKGALVPQPNALERMIRKAVHMHDENYAKSRFGSGRTSKAPLALPSLGPDKKRILYTIYEYEPLLDSSNMTMDDWIDIAKDLRRSYKLFDGFMILHGTDTLAYTASALSFMLENLGKTVIVTGSQIPIFEARSDGRDNFLGGLIAAGLYNIPEVCVFFNNKLYRGNRTTKRSNGSLDAFYSPNHSPLASFGIDVHVDYRSVFRPATMDRFRVHSILNRNVCLLRLFPSITIQTVRALLHPPIEGVVLQTYGSGNIPSNRQDLLDELRQAAAKGVLIINITQCCHGAVSAIYETGAALMEAGVITGADMTPEAALTKLSYVLSKSEWDLDMKRQMMMTNLRGELTAVAQTTFVKNPDLLEAIGRYLNMTSDEEMDRLKEFLFPSLLCSAVKTLQLDRLHLLQKSGANLSATDYDGRTPLHVAASNGHLAIVEFLLSQGASVHMKDLYQNTPLMSAISSDQHEVIKMMIQCGAHLTQNSTVTGDVLCSAAARGKLERLQSYVYAEADMNTRDFSNRTPIQLAVQHNQEKCVDFLLEHGARPELCDDFGRSALDICRHFNRTHLLDKLERHVTSVPAVREDSEPVP